jgi:hypothetical protein
MNQTVTADFYTLFEQSKDTACDYFEYAKKELAGQNMKYTASDVIALAQIMAYDLRTSSILIAAQKLEGAVGDIVESIDSLGFSADMIRDIIEERGNNV